MAYRNYSVANGFVVDKLGNGDFITIATALTAATSGTTIFIRPGTYTENLTLKAGVNLTAFGSDSSLNATGKVIISGNCTLSTAGSVTISGIQLQTNSAALLTVSGSVASIVNLQNCYLNCTNSTGISFTSSSASAQINLNDCNGNLGTTGIALFSSSSAGIISFLYSRFFNTGGSSTSSTISAGAFVSIWSNFASPITSSGTSATTMFQTIIDTAAQNATSYTVGGSGTNGITFSQFYSGSATALNTSTTVVINTCFISSTNTNAIDGAGSLNYSNLTFAAGASVKIATTTQVGGIASGGLVQAPSPGFIGETINSTAAPAVTSGVISNITSINLTPGIWSISGLAQVVPSISITNLSLAISLNSASFTGVNFGQTGLQLSSGATAVLSLSISPFVTTITTAKTFFLVVQPIFSGIAQAPGSISATRIG